MSTKTEHLPAHLLFLVVLLGVSGSVGCWEQWSESWFPQMKWQKAIQPFERVEFEGQVDPFMPPEGAVAIDAENPAVAQYDSAADLFQNPQEPNFKSVGRGQEIYEIYCETCHGLTGMGDGPISMAGEQQGPMTGVFPLVTAAARSDGYLYNLIRAGGQRMPAYARIQPEDRWHLVNYVRYLQKGGQP
ncbi:MAG: hypothetical protein CL910_13280 [Deltaproteobacteria bacterium]|nr:hypothetical protein [Deltaproteobacteria bacterium]